MCVCVLVCVFMCVSIKIYSTFNKSDQTKRSPSVPLSINTTVSIIINNRLEPSIVKP